MTKALTKIEKPVFDQEKLKKLPKAALIQMLEESLLPVNDPERYKAMVKAQMPELVRDMENKEDMGTKMFEAGTQMSMVYADCLRRYHGWEMAEIKQLHKEVTETLTGVAEFEDAGLSMLSLNSVRIVGDNVEDLGIGGLLRKIAEVRLHKTKMEKANIEFPKIAEKPFTKRIENGKD